MNEVKVIRKIGHLPRATVVYEWQCPPNCPDCRRERREPVLIHTYHTDNTIDKKRPLMGNTYCKKCNRWGDHDETANHGD